MTLATRTGWGTRTLLPRTGHYVVPTTGLIAYLANRLLHEQRNHAPEKTIQWGLAMFDVTPVAGGAAPRDIASIASTVASRLNGVDLTLRSAIAVLSDVLTAVYGHQLRVTGWLPGFRVAEGRSVLRLTGNPCPSCTSNPTGYAVGDPTHTARCLNSEDCGWTSA